MNRVFAEGHGAVSLRYPVGYGMKAILVLGVGCMSAIALCLTTAAVADTVPAVRSGAAICPWFLSRPLRLEESLQRGVPSDPETSGVATGNSLRIVFHAPNGYCVLGKREFQLLENFAALQALDIQWFHTAHREETAQVLLAGRADLIAGVSLGETTVTGLLETLPWGQSWEMLVDRSGTTGKTDDEAPSLVEGRQIAVRRDSRAWSLLQDLVQQYPATHIVEVPRTLSEEQFMQRVITGQYDMGVSSSVFLETYLPSHPELKSALRLTDPEMMTWVVHEKSKTLHAKLDAFINGQILLMDTDSVSLGDFDAILKRKSLRMITTSSAAHYFLDNGEPHGFEYELLARFAKFHRLLVEVVLAGSREEMVTMLKQGKGDLIAASLPVREFSEMPDISLSRAYHHSAPVIAAARARHEKLADPSALSGYRIVIAPDASWPDQIEELRRIVPKLEFVSPRAGSTLTEILQVLSREKKALALVGQHQLIAAMNRAHQDVEILFFLDEPQALGWAVRKTSRRLLAELDNFIDGMYRSETYNVILERYFPQSLPAKLASGDESELLSPYDQLVIRHAKAHNFDWRLILAVMYQESRFDPEALSVAGAEGLMQLTPDTQDFMNMREPKNPEESILAGIRYLDYLRSRFEDSLLPRERTWFSLAAYNAGFNRIKSARERADKMNLDSDRWFDNVEFAMQEMARPFKKNGRMTRRCRCGQTVVYVREIRNRYRNYFRYHKEMD